MAKLDAICSALKFLKCTIIPDPCHPACIRATQTIEVLSGWKTTLRRQKRVLWEKRLSDLSSENLSLVEESSLLDCSLLRAHFNEACKSAEENSPSLTTVKMDQASISIARNLLYKNWQRPGAIANATLQEFEQCKVMQVGNRREPLFVMKVHKHKTATEDPARVVMDKIDQARTALYIETVHNLQNTSDSPLLFVLSGGRPISKLSSRLKSVGRRYNLDLPNASRVRKIGATSVALNLDDKEARLVTCQMSHSVAYYQADMDLTDPLTMSVALPDDDNVSGSVFTDVDKDVADLSTSIATGEVELEAIVVDTDETSDSEERRVAQFAADGCSCNLGVKGSPCHQLFSATQYREMRDECRELSREELDLVVMGELRALTLRDRITQRSSERRRTFSKFQFGGHRVCKKTFCFLHNISFGKFHAIKSSWLENGLRPRERKHVTPHNVTNLSDIQYVIHFILHYSEDNAILLPGRVPGYKRDDIQLLPTSVTKREGGMESLFHCSITTGLSCCELLSLLSFLEATNSTGCCEQTKVGLVLDMSEKQHSHHEVSQQTCGREDSGI